MSIFVDETRKLANHIIEDANRMKDTESKAIGLDMQREVEELAVIIQ